MKCAFCGGYYPEEDARSSCKGCPMGSGCHMLRCPHCGYETPPEPGLVKAVKKWWRRRNASARKG